MRGLGALFVGIALVVSGGCSRTFTGKAIQPNPLSEPNEMLRSSERITIVRGDMELDVPDPAAATQRASVVNNQKWRLFNVASFTIVSRDRLRFHVQIDHKWKEYADLTTWKVRLEDDAGHVWHPQSVEHARTKIMTTMWDREQQTARRNKFGDIVALNDDGWKRRQTLGSLSVFRGKADFVFYQRDLFHKNVRRLRLIVSRPGEAFEFIWQFQDDTVAENSSDD
jgi:hypothetical protein